MKLLRYLVNTILFVVIWCIPAFLFVGISLSVSGTRPSAIAGVGGIVAIIISYRLVKRINKSNLWASLFDETETVNDVVEEKKVEVKEEKIEKKVQIEDTNSDKQFEKIMEKFSKKTFIILIMIIPLYFLGVYINDSLKKRKYCNYEREGSFERTYPTISDDKNPDFNQSIHLKYTDGIMSYKAKISDSNYKPDNHIYAAYDNEGKREGTYEVSPKKIQAFKDKMALKGITFEKGQPKRPDKDITKTYLYELAESYRSISMDVELLDKEGFLIKEFTINNFKLEDERVYPKGYSWHTEEFLIAKGSIEMSHSLFKKISCYKRSCNECGERSREPYDNIKLSVSY
ncbi:hypothetical protein OAR04_03230 [Flavobacteriales bacterium]|nr:hypothetical protein [Flavobacteriales bacterium]